MNFEKKSQKNFRKNVLSEKKEENFGFFFQNHEMRTKIESRNSGDHKL